MKQEEARIGDIVYVRGSIYHEEDLTYIRKNKPPLLVRITKFNRHSTFGIILEGEVEVFRPGMEIEFFLRNTVSVKSPLERLRGCKSRDLPNI